MSEFFAIGAEDGFTSIAGKPRSCEGASARMN